MKAKKRLMDFIHVEDAGVGEATAFRTAAILTSVALGSIVLAPGEAQAACRVVPPGTGDTYTGDPHYCGFDAGHIDCDIHGNICC